MKEWLTAQDTYTLHKPVHYKFVYKKVEVGRIDHQWQANVVDVASLK